MWNPPPSSSSSGGKDNPITLSSGANNNPPPPHRPPPPSAAAAPPSAAIPSAAPTTTGFVGGGGRATSSVPSAPLASSGGNAAPPSSSAPAMVGSQSMLGGKPPITSSSITAAASSAATPSAAGATAIPKTLSPNNPKPKQLSLSSHTNNNNAPKLSNNNANSSDQPKQQPKQSKPKKKTLSAILWRGGNEVKVRVFVGKEEILGPLVPVGGASGDAFGSAQGVGGSGVSGDGRMMSNADMQNQREFERSLSGSTSSNMGDQEHPADNAATNANAATGHHPNASSSMAVEDSNTSSANGSDAEDEEVANANANATHNANVHNAADHRPSTRRRTSITRDMEGGGGLSRENSTSSDGIPSGDPNANTAGGAAGGGGGGPEAGSNFEASLLLGIAADPFSASNTSNSSLEKEKREIIDPTTLPTSMTSFLDMLTEDQRPLRHRHIPGVEGFRKLYKSEVKADMSEARRMKRTVVLPKESGAGGGGDAMEVEESKEQDTAATTTPATATTAAGTNVGERSSDDKTQEKNNTNNHKKRKTSLPDRNAFVVPCKEVRKSAGRGQLAGMLDSTDFENALRGNVGTVSGGSSAAAGAATAGAAANSAANGANGANNASNGANTANTRKSPLLVDSLTSFDPPRPQESTSAKTKRRLARWEARPHEVESDLANYRKTVYRTRSELHNARKERERIESVATLARDHFRGHLGNYRREMCALHAALFGTASGGENGGGGGSGSTSENSSITKGILEECLKLEEQYGGRRNTRGGSSRGMKDALATLKALGEEVKGVRAGGAGSGAGGGSSGGSGGGGGAIKDWKAEGVGGVSCKEGELASGWFLPGDDVIVAASGAKGKIVSIRGPTDKNNDAMDIDAPGKDSSIPSTTVDVRLETGTIQNFRASDIAFDPSKPPTLAHAKDIDLAQRWQEMMKSALSNAVDHDSLAMDKYIQASLAEEAKEEDAAAATASDGPTEKDGKEDTNKDVGVGGGGGGGSPKSVTHYDDDESRALLPFGAGLVAAPLDVRNYPSVIPLDTLEERVRKVVYETDKPRVIVSVPSSTAPKVQKCQGRKEEINALKGKVLQLRNRLGRQKRLRSLNERTLVAGRNRAFKVEGLLLEMQMDLTNLKERLQDELNEIGIGNSPLQPLTPEDDMDDDEAETLEEEEVPKEEEAKSSSMVVDATTAEDQGGEDGEIIPMEEAAKGPSPNKEEVEAGEVKEEATVGATNLEKSFLQTKDGEMGANIEKPLLESKAEGKIVATNSATESNAVAGGGGGELPK